jgi:arylsulfatase A
MWQEGCPTGVCLCQKMSRLFFCLFLFIHRLGFASTELPNFILINVDDLGYADISPFGGSVPTPNLERLARDGMRLTSHYAAPVCSPSRAAMLTGCYPKRVLAIPGVLSSASGYGLNPVEITIAELLKAKQYATACIGKWHLGDQSEFLPTRQGFDVFFGIPYSNDMGPAADGARSSVNEPLAEEETQANKKGRKKYTDFDVGPIGNSPGKHPPIPLLEQEQVIERVRVPSQLNLTQRYTQHAQRFIRQNQAQPFFLYLPYHAVHFPHYPAQEFQGQSGISAQKDWVLELDHRVGQLLETLDELKLTERTLIVFTSDNGGPTHQGADNTPFSGSKNSTREGGIRVCTLVSWPGHVTVGDSSNQITTHMDWLPTFAAFAGVPLPPGRKLDGMDLSDLLLGKTQSFKPREDFFYYRGFELEAVRSGAWKLHLSSRELYNLELDPGESQNLAGDHPEVISRLEGLVKEMEKDLGTTGAKAPGMRPLGKTDEEPRPLISTDGTVRKGHDQAVKSLP